jgi:hypothetical protein
MIGGTVTVSGNFFESFYADLVQTHDSVLKELPTNDSEEISVESFFNAFN